MKLFKPAFLVIFALISNDLVLADGKTSGRLIKTAAKPASRAKPSSKTVPSAPKTVKASAPKAAAKPISNNSNKNTVVFASKPTKAPVVNKPKANPDHFINFAPDEDDNTSLISTQENVEFKLNDDLKSALSHLKLFNANFVNMEIQNAKLQKELDLFMNNPSMSAVAGQMIAFQNKIKKLKDDRTALNNLITATTKDNMDLKANLANVTAEYSKTKRELSGKENHGEGQQLLWDSEKKQVQQNIDSLRSVLQDMSTKITEDEQKLHTCQTNKVLNQAKKEEHSDSVDSCKRAKQNRATSLNNYRIKLSKCQVDSQTINNANGGLKNQLQVCNSDHGNCKTQLDTCLTETYKAQNAKVTLDADIKACKQDRSTYANNKKVLNAKYSTCAGKLSDCIINGASDANWTPITVNGRVDRKWYLQMESGKITGHEAKRKCANQGATLANIDNIAVRQAMEKFVVGEINDTAKDFWVRSIFDVSNNKGCMSMDADEKGWSYPCSNKEDGFVCEIKN